jgi:hypothetical protein
MRAKSMMNNNNNRQQQTKAPRPSNELDFQQQMLDPFISSEYVDPSFANKFREFIILKDDKGEPILDANGQMQVTINKDLWGILQMFTRDWRLGNIDKREEAVAIRHFLDLTTDILVTLGDEFREPALMCFERALCVNETSQSKGGFVRRMSNTFFHNTKNVEENSKQKRNFFGFGKKVS